MNNNDKRIMNKLRSKTGASITFGLLLFLVCAVISSVVLVAGTSAAGRLSGMSKNEQRYYSVSSTAKLIQEELEGSSATVLKIDNDYYIVSGTNLKSVSDTSASIDKLPEYIAYQLCKLGTSEGEFGLKLSLKKLDSEAKDVKDVDISATVNADQDISFKISSDDYSVPIAFSTNKKSMPVDISTDSGVKTGTKTVYNWDLSKAASEDI